MEKCWLYEPAERPAFNGDLKLIVLTPLLMLIANRLMFCYSFNVLQKF